jgi:hypothetical protein
VQTAAELINDPACQAYLRELAADIAAHGGIEGRDMAQVIKEAHDRRQAFLAEMWEGQTERAKLAKAELCSVIYNRIRASNGPCGG